MIDFWTNMIQDLPRLSAGAHGEDDGALCAMEMVAYMERLPHSDHPACTCPVLASYVRTLNDNMDGKSRQKLLPILPLLVGTVNSELEVPRAHFFADAAKNRFVPMCGQDANSVWDESIQVLIEAIELDEDRVVAQWKPEEANSLISDYA